MYSCMCLCNCQKLTFGDEVLVPVEGVVLELELAQQLVAPVLPLGEVHEDGPILR